MGVDMLSVLLLQLEGYMLFSFDFLMSQLASTVSILLFPGWNKLLWAVSEPCSTCAQLGGAVAEGWPGAPSANGDRLLWGRLCDGDKLRAAKVCIIVDRTVVDLLISYSLNKVLLGRGNQRSRVWASTYMLIYTCTLQTALTVVFILSLMLLDDVLFFKNLFVLLLLLLYRCD